jgi:hypothetical protein
VTPGRWIRAQWDRVGAWLLITAGLIALLLGWIGVSGTVYPAGQIPYVLSGGIFGFILAGLGAMLWLSADLRDEWRKLDAIEDAIRTGAAETAASSGATPLANVTTYATTGPGPNGTANGLVSGKEADTSEHPASNGAGRRRARPRTARGTES